MLKQSKNIEYFFIFFIINISMAFAEVQPKVLLVYDGSSNYSEIDRSGFAAALDELGAKYDQLNIASSSITLETLQNYPCVVFSELTLSEAEVSDVINYVNDGGGIILTGKSANGMEEVLGITSYASKSTTGSEDIRFEVEHPVSHGCFWDGPSMTSPPMPEEEIPTITQFLYPEVDWPAYYAVNNSGTVIAHWYADADNWGTSEQEAAVIVNGYGNGKTVYCGALPGVYNDVNWKWPFVWRRLIVNAVEWASDDEYLVEIGYWPSAYNASFVWSGDTEKPDMESAVPAILDVFETVGLNNFGTFYVVSKAGGDEGTEGTQEHPGVVEMIVENGSEVGGHGDIHTGFSGLTFEENASRLQDMIDINNGVINPYGESCRGFRAPYVDFDGYTLEACAQVGLLYESSDLDVWTETTFPFFNRVWEVPPTMPMDWTLFGDTPLSDEDAITIYKDKFDFIYAKRSMFNWLCHSWVINGHLNVLQDVLQYAIDKQYVWMARQDSLIEWWAKKVNLSTESVSRGGDTLDVTVKNNGQSATANAAVWLKMRQGMSSDGLSAKIGETEISTFARQHNGQNFSVAVIPQIEAGGQVTVRYSPNSASIISGNKPEQIETFKLRQNYPNPFNPATKIPFNLSRKTFVTIKVYNVKGKLVDTLVNEEKSTGAYEIVFNGSVLPSGVYYYQMKLANGYTETKKLVLIK